MGLSNSYGGGWLPCAHAHDETLSWQSIQGSHPLLLRPAFLLIVESTKPQAWAASKAQGIEGLGAGEARETWAAAFLAESARGHGSCGLWCRTAAAAFSYFSIVGSLKAWPRRDRFLQRACGFLRRAGESFRPLPRPAQA